MSAALGLVGLLLALWFWRTGRWSAIWGAMTGAMNLAGATV